MVVGIIEISFVLYETATLKFKRSVIKRLIARCKNSFNVAMSEIEDHDYNDRMTLAAVMVGNDRRIMQKNLDHLENFIDQLALAQLIDTHKVIENY